MRIRIVLAIIFLAVGLCFVPGLGYGEIRQDIVESKVSLIDFHLLQARVNYMMVNPTDFSDIDFFYDPDGRIGRNQGFPEAVDTKRKICVAIVDRGCKFPCPHEFDESDLWSFELKLTVLYTYISRNMVDMDMDTDIVAVLYHKDGIPLGYFYQGESHPWKE